MRHVGDVAVFTHDPERNRAAEKVTALAALRDLVDGRTDTSERLRALWALHVTGGLTVEDAAKWVQDGDEWIRAWTVQLFFENSGPLFSSEVTADLAEKSVAALAQLAANDRSPVVRRFVASALQRVPVEKRWDTLTALLQHAEDADDHNLPLLYWYAAEGSVATDRTRALALLKSSRLPKLREFIARRLTQAALTLSNKL